MSSFFSISFPPSEADAGIVAIMIADVVVAVEAAEGAEAGAAAVVDVWDIASEGADILCCCAEGGSGIVLSVCDRGRCQRYPCSFAFGVMYTLTGTTSVVVVSDVPLGM